MNFSRVGKGVALLALCSQARALHAQDMIDAFRGDEIEDRSYDYDRQHFLNALSFDFDPTKQRQWDLAPNGYRGTAGSLNSREILLHQEMKMFFPGGERITARLQFLQSEDFDSRYMRFLVEPLLKLDANWTLGAPMQVMPAKEDMDLGASIGFHDEGIHYLKFTWLFQNAFFNTETRLAREYSHNPGTIAFQGSVDGPGGSWWRWTVGQALPLELEVNDQSFDFRFSRSFYKLFGQTPTGEDSQLFVSISGEQAYKIREYVSALSSLDRSLHRSAAQIRAEWHKALGSGKGIVGAQYFGLRESDEFLLQPANSEFNLRREAAIFLGYEFSLGQESSLGVTGFVDFQNNRRKEASTNYVEEIDDNPISKIDFAYRHSFSPKAHLVLNPTVQFFGTTPYGGTNVQLVVTF